MHVPKRAAALNSVLTRGPHPDSEASLRDGARFRELLSSQNSGILIHPNRQNLEHLHGVVGEEVVQRKRLRLAVRPLVVAFFNRRLAVAGTEKTQHVTVQGKELPARGLFCSSAAADNEPGTGFVWSCNVGRSTFIEFNEKTELFQALSRVTAPTGTVLSEVLGLVQLEKAAHSEQQPLAFQESPRERIARQDVILALENYGRASDVEITGRHHAAGAVLIRHAHAVQNPSLLKPRVLRPRFPDIHAAVLEVVRHDTPSHAQFAGAFGDLQILEVPAEVKRDGAEL
eukprot:CAMPEP_0117632946 /NCGR_PEP_ID=MMETSP0802-20121206/4864_1 /TAXON_ID=38833 /ORGANISM="Micromonas sp., Strain CCMP2099" /LENGTH=285 /DNA_ID=CAMNT_0005437445 /DNA_START=964 /DNA_END=1824 /DNA_ORIENTATION=+